jgi:NAD(P)-dependent dehydrogenase (short-subunit alcohol dehydrogenase family)
MMAVTSGRGIVVVTGTSSGIGRATALRLAREGFHVFASVRKEADGRSLLSEAGGGARITPLLMDVTDGASIAAAAEVVEKAAGADGVAGLVNNAGVGLSAPVEHLPLDQLRSLFEVNVFGQVAVTQAFLPLLRRAKGRIVNIGSVGDRIAIPFGGALCASKAALASLNDALRMELRPWGVHVCLVEPGFIVTPAIDKTLGGIDELIAALPPEGARRYGQTMRDFTRSATKRERSGSPPTVVADAVLRALTEKSPSARYPVGQGARVLTTLPRVLPDSLLDRVRLRMLGLPRRFGALER